jgi:ubiquinone/menaquinone biosynthesis C-methylase UbiE
MMSMIGYLGAQAVIDVGAGTGISIFRIKNTHPEVRAIGIEPSAHLR